MAGAGPKRDMRLAVADQDDAHAPAANIVVLVLETESLGPPHGDNLV